jgi:hypothetical protein
MTYINQQVERVQEYDNIFKIENMCAVSKVEMKVIQGITVQTTGQLKT